MDQTYYDTVSQMEKDGINAEYMDGWMSGYLRNPKREEQRINDAYEAGYADGENKTTDKMNEYKQ